MDFDSERIFYSDQSLRAPPPKFSDPFAVTNATVSPGGDENDPNTDPNASTADDAKYEEEKKMRTQNVQGKGRNGGISYSLPTVQRNFREFLRNYSLPRPSSSVAAVPHYRPLLLSSHLRGTHVLTVNLSHLNDYDPMLLSLLMESPSQIIPAFEAGAKEALRSIRLRDSRSGLDDSDSDDEDGSGAAKAARDDPDVAINFKAPNMKPTELRNITSKHVHKLLKTPGIIISATRIRSKARTLSLTCKGCSATQKISITDAYGTARLPSRCPSGGNECGMAPFMVMPDECSYVDTQSLKLQESPESVPTGEMPRNVLLAVDRHLVDCAKPGMRVTVVGVASLYKSNGGKGKDAPSVKQIYVNVVGIEFESESARDGSSFTPREEEAFTALSRRRDIYSVLSSSVAPSIQGSYTDDIKKAIVCQLMGGAAKRLPDGMRLRGDINLLLLGDPSTAKSQFLKFVEKVAPVGVYTSGKGSSAAGLTASVIKDSRGEFYLEGGAMVLADGGVVCIDEFDKMRPADRVAIHEAMEQQTISVAKAGITTVLNSRASVLAAANPIFGRYDDLRSAGENIDLMTTILSRFDLIFIVRDVRDEERDKAICRHVMGVHVNAGGPGGGGPEGAGGGAQDDQDDEPDDDDDDAIAEKAMRVAEEGGKLDIKTFKKFVQFVRSRCSPRLSEASSEVLASQYVKIRDSVRARCAQAGGDTAQVVPITVRQLEALVRLSESLAKMRLSATVAAEDVAEALRLFKVSTMAASETDATNGQDLLQQSAAGPDRDAYARCESFLRSRLPPGSACNKPRLLEEAVGAGMNANIVARVVRAFCQRGEFVEKNSGRVLKRIK